jgi:rubrerythrin
MEGKSMGDLTVRAVLGYAIEKELEARERYTQMAEKAEKDTTRELFLRLAGMEKEHEEKLRGMTERDVADYRLENVPDLHVGEKLGKRDFHSDMTMIDALALAIKAEEAAKNLYLDAARELPEGSDMKIFAVLAEEEMQHKLDLEREYRQLKSECQ